MEHMAAAGAGFMRTAMASEAVQAVRQQGLPTRSLSLFVVPGRAIRMERAGHVRRDPIRRGPVTVSSEHLCSDLVRAQVVNRWDPGAPATEPGAAADDEIQVNGSCYSTLPNPVYVSDLSYHTQHIMRLDCANVRDFLAGRAARLRLSHVLSAPPSLPPSRFTITLPPEY